MVHTQLDNSATVKFAQAQNSLRYANLVIEIALRCQCTVPKRTAQNTGKHLGDRCFTVATCDGDHRKMHLASPAFG